jgi:FAD/FMN-containing dehydrogenase
MSETNKPINNTLPPRSLEVIQADWDRFVDEHAPDGYKKAGADLLWNLAFGNNTIPNITPTDIDNLDELIKGTGKDFQDLQKDLLNKLALKWMDIRDTDKTNQKRAVYTAMQGLSEGYFRYAARLTFKRFPHIELDEVLAEIGKTFNVAMTQYGTNEKRNTALFTTYLLSSLKRIPEKIAGQRSSNNRVGIRYIPDHEKMSTTIGSLDESTSIDGGEARSALLEDFREPSPDAAAESRDEISHLLSQLPDEQRIILTLQLNLHTDDPEILKMRKKLGEYPTSKAIGSLMKDENGKPLVPNRVEILAKRGIATLKNQLRVDGSHEEMLTRRQIAAYPDCATR